MPNAIFTITSDQETNHFCAAGAGELRRILAVIYRAKLDAERNPSFVLTVAHWLMHSALLHTLHPLDTEDFAESLVTFRRKPGADIIVMVDYEANKFEISEWTPDGIRTMSGPLDKIISAYSKALIKSGAAPIYFDEKVFAAEIELVCSVETAVSMYEGGSVYEKSEY